MNKNNKKNTVFQSVAHKLNTRLCLLVPTAFLKAI